MSRRPRLKVPEAFRPAYEAALAAGWTVTRTGGGHLRWKPPQGGPVFTGATPGGRRSKANTLSDLRAAGLEFGRRK